MAVERAAGLAVPLALHTSTPYLVVFNLTGVLFGASVLMAWFLVQIEALERRNLVDWTTQLRLLTSQEFEWFVGEIFKREGFQVKD
jgi:hypothetical protein